VIVSHTGEVVWLSHGIFRSSCDINVEFFPFDEQRCALKWASWTYDGYQVSFTFYILSRTFDLHFRPNANYQSFIFAYMNILIFNRTDHCTACQNFFLKTVKFEVRFVGIFNEIIQRCKFAKFALRANVSSFAINRDQLEDLDNAFIFIVVVKLASKYILGTKIFTYGMAFKIKFRILRHK